MKNLLLLFSILTISFSTTNCTILFGKKSQKFQINSVTDGSQVIVNNITYNEARLSLDLIKENQIIINQKEGYLSNSEVISPHKKTGVPIVTFLVTAAIAVPIGIIMSSNTGNDIPLRVGIGAPLLLTTIDYNSKKNKKFENTVVSFEPLIKVPIRNESQKYIFVDKVDINIKSGDFTINYYNSSASYYDEKYSDYSQDNSDDFKGSVKGLSKDINTVLAEYNLTDTSKAFLKNNYESLKLDCEIVSTKFTYVDEFFISYETSINWKVKNPFGKCFPAERI
jgi:hypothetical protein